MINFGPLDGKGPIRNLLESTIDKSPPISQVTNVCMYVRMCLCAYVRMHACMYVCMYVC